MRIKKFFQSGGAFIVVALLCIVAGLISQNASLFTVIGAFWLIVAVITRTNYAKKPTEDKS
jgi:hypothetical protein